jgi:hypothetical protein
VTKGVHPLVQLWQGWRYFWACPAHWAALCTGGVSCQKWSMPAMLPALLLETCPCLSTLAAD